MRAKQTETNKKKGILCSAKVQKHFVTEMFNGTKRKIFNLHESRRVYGVEKDLSLMEC